MIVQELEHVIERTPFRPFLIRLSSGVTYEVTTRRDIGAWQDYRVLHYFMKPSGSVRIDAEHIAEIIERD